MFFQNTELHNVAELEPLETGWHVLRVPSAVRAHLNEMAYVRSIAAAGAEIRFTLTGEQATITLQMEEEPAIAEVYAGPFLVRWHVIDHQQPTTIVCERPPLFNTLVQVAQQANAPFAVDCHRVILPRLPAVRLIDISGAMRPPTPDQTPAVRWLAYGSSITQGTVSIRPTDPFVMRTARALGVDVINLGFGGGAHCEPELAKYIGNRPDWDFATLELGINMFGQFDVATFTRRIETFISTIVRAQPEKWVFCLDMFPFYGDRDDNQAKANAFRMSVAQVVADLNHPKLVHLPAPPMLPDLTGLTHDVLHPAPEGMEQIASALAQQLRGYIPIK